MADQLAILIVISESYRAIALIKNIISFRFATVCYDEVVINTVKKFQVQVTLL